jgi:hypothetical protein
MMKADEPLARPGSSLPSSAWAGVVRSRRIAKAGLLADLLDMAGLVAFSHDIR